MGPLWLLRYITTDALRSPHWIGTVLRIVMDRSESDGRDKEVGRDEVGGVSEVR